MIRTLQQKIVGLQQKDKKELGDYEAFDAEVKANDQFVFREYLTRGMNDSAVYKLLSNNFGGFNATWWAQVQMWNSTVPTAAAAAGPR